jgi:hypothetical protein
MIELALLSFGAILVAWIFAPDGPRVKSVEQPKVVGSVVPARA